MLEINNQQHFDEVCAFADRVGLRDQLDEKLRYLDEYAEHGDRGKTRCQLNSDFAPYSWGFVLERRADDGEYHHWFTGGLIFHGPHDAGGSGSYPTLAVTLSPITGWSIHT